MFAVPPQSGTLSKGSKQDHGEDRGTAGQLHDHAQEGQKGEEGGRQLGIMDFFGGWKRWHSI